MSKNYYKILDISEFSTSDEIKNAYRKLARKWHPDIAGNTPDVIAKFKEINEAYEILSNCIKKSDYDKAQKFYSYAKNTKSNFKETKNEKQNNTKNDTKTTSQTKDNFKFNWEDFFYKAPKKEAKATKRGNDIYSDIEISIFEAIGGTIKTINMLQTNICPKCNGRRFVNGTKCLYCQGKGETSTYKRFSVKIPAGIKDNSKIRLAGEGEKGINGGTNGDLYITIHIQEPKNYKTEGLNILKTIAITPYEAVLGANITIPTLKGNVAVKIAPSTKNGQKIRLSGCGIEQNNKVGDLILTLEIQIPKNLSDEEIQLYKKLAEISTSNTTIRDNF